MQLSSANSKAWLVAIGPLSLTTPPVSLWSSLSSHQRPSKRSTTSERLPSALCPPTRTSMTRTKRSINLKNRTRTVVMTAPGSSSLTQILPRLRELLPRSASKMSTSTRSAKSPADSLAPSSTTISKPCEQFLRLILIYTRKDCVLTTLQALYYAKC